MIAMIKRGGVWQRYKLAGRRVGFIALACLAAVTDVHVAAAADKPQRRQVLSLDGVWQIAEGMRDKRPSCFDRQIPVPGLADMANPPFAEVGTEKSGPYRDCFWYRRTFTVADPYPAVVRLKLHKAMYGTRVYLNGKLVGEHLPCFTPVESDIRRFLSAPGERNELVVCVGAHRNVLPRGMPDGRDHEKFAYPPGIYDSVELILSGAPRVASVQAVPDLETRAVRVVAEVEDRVKTGGQVSCRVSEVRTGKLVGSGQASYPAGRKGGSVDLRIPIAGCRFWSPEDPFLYELEVSTPGDTLGTRFGVRSFRLDRQTGHAVLNGKPYFLRGTNVCIFRFFEDPKRGDLPWREDWVRRLHRVFRDMHWNSVRYCIGFPPEQWYRIADEEGLLIQDEFPVWYDRHWPVDFKSAELVKEYTEWMRERWNHPCVVIWDAQNETITPETGKAIRAVRHLDLSGRPWDNGESPPQDPGDSFEAHPYVFPSEGGFFRLADFAHTPGSPGSPGGVAAQNVRRNVGGNPVIINEYCSGFLDREGNSTNPRTAEYYQENLGAHATAEQRQEFRARTIAAETEFWRAGRQVAGVLHFCGLAYSKPNVVTSDHFLNLEKLTLEPNFRRYMGDAFAPVGLMVDFWAEDWPAGRACQVPVIVINDLDADWKGTVRLRAIHGVKMVQEQTQPCAVPALRTRTVRFPMSAPAETGKYQWIAELNSAGGAPVQSLRDFAVLPPAEWREEIARGKAVVASSSIREDVTLADLRHPATGPAAVVDGNVWTCWASKPSDAEWIAVDLGHAEKISHVDLIWPVAYGRAENYAIQVSLDGQIWKDVVRVDGGRGGREILRFSPVEARWVRMLGKKRRSTLHGYRLFEFRVFR
jgi:hypothetical protein